MRRPILALLAAASLLTAQASDFFNTEKSEDLLTFGARIGVNTSNRTMCGKAYPGFSHNESWGTGFEIGAVANLNFRDYLSLQPGIFFETRSGSYSLLGNTSTLYDAPGTDYAQAGKRRSYNFTIPVMAVVGFNVTNDLRWTVEAGPYVSFVLSSKLRGTRVVSEHPQLFHGKAAGVDFGIKMGTGLQVFKHYYVGAHYMAGCVDAWKDKSLGDGHKLTYGGVTKAWVFTLGYNF